MARYVKNDWVSSFADDVINEAERRALRTPIVCASGLSPAGPIHLGKLREVMTPHLVADEVRRRGHECVHIISWDDYDHLRNIPAGIDPSWAEHLGKPLSSVPAPPGSTYENWAEHYKAPMVAALDELNIEFRSISQTEMYTSGAYREQILLAMENRERISQILYLGNKSGRRPADTRKGSQWQPAVEVGDVKPGWAEISQRESRPESSSYMPYMPFCSACDRDFTTVTSYCTESTELSYVCICSHSETFRLDTENRGKLPWKVDWPMRWAYEGVLFEPAGANQSSPGSAFVLGSQLIREIFGAEPPIGPISAFVEIAGGTKMSASLGDVPIPTDALQVMEPSVLRWLYIRRKPSQTFKVALDDDVPRAYDLWDELGRRITRGIASPGDLKAHNRATTTVEGPLPSTPNPIPFRLLTSVLDMTACNDVQVLRLIGELNPNDPVLSINEIQPRLDRARCWVATRAPAEGRTYVNDEPDRELLDSLEQIDRDSLRLLLVELDSHWSLEGLTELIYGVPKVIVGGASEARVTPEVKRAQRHFCFLLYQLLTGRESGPRLPTLLLAIGKERVHKLLATENLVKE